jgi:glutamyl-tRNA reductase
MPVRNGLSVPGKHQTAKRCLCDAEHEQRFEAVRRSEIHRVRGRLGNLSSDQEDVVESLSRGIVEKVLQSAVAMLLNAAATNQSAFVVETVRRIFNLRT